VLDKKIGVGQPRRMENARILVANTPMDTDKVIRGLVINLLFVCIFQIKIYGSKVEVDSMTKVAEVRENEQKIVTSPFFFYLIKFNLLYQ